MKEYLSDKSAAKIIEMSPSFVQKLRLSGQIPYIRVGNEARIDRDDLDDWMQRRKEIHCCGNRRDSKHRQPIPTTEAIFAKR
jgi:excisionase family DNA binding protein